MEKKDPSLLFHLASFYYEAFRFTDYTMSKLLKVFCAKHLEILSGNVYDKSMGWTVSTQADLWSIINCFKDPYKTLCPAPLQIYKTAKKFLESVPSDLPWD